MLSVLNKVSRSASTQGGPRAGRAPEHKLQVLVADFFLILGALAWFIAGVLLKAGAQSTVCHDQQAHCKPDCHVSCTDVPAAQALLDSWYSLWGILFQPALGVLMLGAVSCPVLPASAAHEHLLTAGWCTAHIRRCWLAEGQAGAWRRVAGSGRGASFPSADDLCTSSHNSHVRAL